MTQVVIHQPDFLSYIGFFERLVIADVYVILDHVQFVSGTSKSWMHRDKIKTSSGPRWISLSLEKKNSFAPINTVRLSQSVDWRSKNMNQISAAYCKAPYFAEVWPLIEQIYACNQMLMADFNIHSIMCIMDILGLRSRIIRSSDLSPVGTNNEMLIDVLTKTGASSYLSGDGAKSYLRPELFVASGISVQWQEFVHPVYPQLHGEFVPYLSIIDVLFNCGIIGTRRILQQNL